MLTELETIDDDTDKFGVQFVKINDKKLAKKYGISEFPALTYFRNKEPIKYEGTSIDPACPLANIYVIIFSNQFDWSLYASLGD